ncbi:glycine oxidase ThiO [Streptomonospora nanhaiensis]|uniref:glycine oxidase n=1 Tax=Streptomonospora nanhaiensis TaxID=1323731 RepID=A0A853BHG3_9ACTN|nr:glycine oxidase ThiO [Streptomonospora nanhaiensis]NYI94918.1 glycine oxidase [Streptomonospora nanhaiensis]
MCAAISASRSPDVVVVGAGLIGLVTAWRAARRGLAVTVVAETAEGAASPVAAGMLTPATEAAFGEEALMRFGVLSRDRYPAFVAELEDDSGLPAGYRPHGTLQVAFDADDLARLAHLSELRARLGLRTERLTGRECRRLEPMLAPAVRGGYLAPDDHSVDPRRLLSALYAAAERRGAVGVRDRVREVVLDGDRVRGVRLASGGELAAGQVVLAAGVGTPAIGGLPPGVVPPLRPVKGQLLRLRTTPGEPPLVERTVRGLVRGSPVYLVPRDDGEIVLGATQEEQGHDTRLTAGGLWEVLRDAHELVPGVSELEVAETCVGLRPGSPDNEPLLGPTAVPGLHLAAGHFRHGVLFTPATGDAMAEALTTGALPGYARRFAATRALEAVGGTGTGGDPDQWT